MDAKCLFCVQNHLCLSLCVFFVILICNKHSSFSFTWSLSALVSCLIAHVAVYLSHQPTPAKRHRVCEPRTSTTGCSPKSVGSSGNIQSQTDVTTRARQKKGESESWKKTNYITQTSIHDDPAAPLQVQGEIMGRGGRSDPHPAEVPQEASANSSLWFHTWLAVNGLRCHAVSSFQWGTV